MIIVPNAQHFKINVQLKNGKYFHEKDITNRPLGERENWVSFWYRGKIRAYPREMVHYYEFVPEGTSDE